jgi:hypothetical protein
MLPILKGKKMNNNLFGVDYNKGKKGQVKATNAVNEAGMAAYLLEDA